MVRQKAINQQIQTMKKLLLLGLTLVLFTSCQKAERYTTTSSNIDEMKALIADYNAGNWEGWMSHYADSAKLYHNSLKAATPQEIRDALKGILTNVSSYGFAEKNAEGEDNLYFEQIISDEGNTWVNFWGGWHGTLKANGEELDIPVHLTCKMVDNKIVEEDAYYDMSKYAAAMEAIEKANNMPVEEKTIDAQIEKFVSEFLNKKDASVLGDILADNFVRYMNDVKESSGAAELASNMDVFFKGFPDFKITLLHKSPIFNNTRFVHWQMTGTNTGEFNGSAATGKQVKITGLSRLHFNGNGKIDEEDVFYDQLSLMQQLGKN